MKSWTVTVVMGASLVLLPAIACQTSGSAPAQLIDLTHSFDEHTVYWPTEEGFVLDEGTAGISSGGYYYEAHSFRGAEHGGTHIDAPVHFFEGGDSVDAIGLTRLVAPGVAIDVRSACARNRDHKVTRAELQDFESRHGRIPDGAIVLLNTGFAESWPDRARYMGTDERGAEGVVKLHFPGLAPDAARWLIEERDIAAIGLDTPSIDFDPSRDFLTHRILFEAGIPAFENVGDMKALPASGFEVIALPMKIAGGSGAPLRILARVPAACD